VQPVSAPFVGEQLERIFGDMGADAVKVGMLYSPDLIEVVAGQLRKFGAEHVVLDPVFASQGGRRLLMEEAVEPLKTQLIPLAEVLTPNLAEASLLLGRSVRSTEDMAGAARELASLGSPCVLLKGGHSAGDDSIDVLYVASEDRTVHFSAERVVTRNDHGTGCTLSSAIACHLAMGLPVEGAVREAKVYISKALKAGSAYGLGLGRGPLHHFFDFW
jgi:hydroxymethylpyrimidine/phosphomethylpyrimidine kinase